MTNEIVLSPRDTSFIKTKTLRRRRNNRARGIEDQVIAHKGKSVEKDLIGTAGEYAVCKFFGLPVETIRETTPDSGFDLLIDGLRTEIKSTPYSSGCFCTTAGRSLDAERGILVVVRNGRVRLAGWIDKETFQQRRVWRDDWPKPTYAVYQKDLKSMAEWGQLSLK